MAAEKAAITSKPERVLILGAAGRDFDTFNVCFRDDPNFQVAARRSRESKDGATLHFFRFGLESKAIEQAGSIISSRKTM